MTDFVSPQKSEKAEDTETPGYPAQFHEAQTDSELRHPVLTRVWIPESRRSVTADHIDKQKSDSGMQLTQAESTGGRQQWRQQKQREDEQRKKFFEEVNRFPNLFNLKPLLHPEHRRRAQQLLEKQRDELASGWFQYPMETDRCHNLIVFLLYLVDQTKEALDYCENLGQGSDGDIIRLTNLAVLQWEMGQRKKAKKTLTTLQALSTSSRFPFLKAVAVSEQGHAFTHFGPKYFLRAIDLLREAVRGNSQSEIFLWKYDLAIAIRRHLNVFVYREHSSSSAADLAEEAWNLLNDIRSRCPNQFYRARGLTELALLVSHIKTLMKVCKDRERSGLAKLCEINLFDYIDEALQTDEGQNDHFVLRAAGRLFMYHNKLDKAEEHLSKSLAKKKDNITYQLLAKLSLKRYRWEQRDTGRSFYLARVRDQRSRDQAAPAQAQDRSSAGLSGQGSSENVQMSQSDTAEAAGGAVSAETPTGLAATLLSAVHVSDVPETHLSTNAEQGQSQTESSPISSSQEPVVASSTIRSILKSFAVATDWYDPDDKHIQMAEEYFREARKVNPYNSGVLFDAGRMYQGMNKHRQALDHFQKVVSNKERPMYLANAYEQSGICLLAMSEQSDITPEKRSELVEQAGDMFTSSMRECKRALRDMPGVSAHRAELWDSYPKLIEILKKSGENTGVAGLQQMARVHEEVGMYLEAIKAHQGILDLSAEPQERKEALLGLMRDHCSSDNVPQARAILDVCVDEGHLTESDDADDDELFSQLRDTAVDVYRLSASHALRERIVGDACFCFQSALTLVSLMQNAAHSRPDEQVFGADGSDQEEHVMGNFDVCIFDDADNLAGESEEEAKRVSKASAAVAVSRNDEGTIPGSLSFEGELRLAETATTVVLVLGPGSELSPRMAFLADRALHTHDPDRVLPVIISESPASPPKPLDHHQPFSDPMHLLELDGGDTDKFMDTLPAHRNTVLGLFDYILSHVYSGN
ncbi:hypothetical protein BaRGS_00032903 [Batillaria attramentaria]|uniref:Uncharacterized protein n=1 Tax=Batillaria attramentaria TaxID=370345 RepID=A0ABD0JLG5_9CAEN